MVATARAMAAEGLVKGSEGNVSVREGELRAHHPARLPYDEMEAGDLVTLDLAGRVVAGEREPSSERRVHLRDLRRPAGRARDRPHPQPPAAAVAPGVELPVPGGLAAFAAPRRRRRAPGAGANGGGPLADGDAVLMARHGVVAVGRASRRRSRWPARWSGVRRRLPTRPPLCDGPHTYQKGRAG